ncbi:MAG: hypothetical protein GY940_22600 [bacterium]|nr:hypothetical protein [bacterium]
MRFSRTNIDERMILYHLALFNGIEDPELQDILLRYNYDASRLNVGMDLYKTADRLIREQKAKYTTQYKAREDFLELYEESVPKFKVHYGLARLAFRDNPSQYNMLGLKTPQKRRYSASITQAKDFYHNTLEGEDVIAALSRYALTREILEEEGKRVGKLEEAYVKKERTMTEAQRATRLRDEAFAELRKWMEEFLGVCRLILTDHPELIEKVGILYRSSKYKKKTATPEENTTPTEEPVTGGESANAVENPTKEPQASPTVKKKTNKT